MSAQHPKSEAWDRALQEIVEAIDHEMELRHGSGRRLHPNRPKLGTTANPQMDGFFNIGLQFTAGYGSDYGRGYVVDMLVSSENPVSNEEKAKWTEEVVGLLREKLKNRFPNRSLELVLDKGLYKIVGDFSLGEV